MEEYIKNRFDGKKPFDVVRAEDFGGDLYDFYEPLEKLIRKVSGVDITGSRPVFLIGGRGTGKTMVLKFLSLEMQLKNFIKNELMQSKSIEELSVNEMKTFLDSLVKFIEGKIVKLVDIYHILNSLKNKNSKIQGKKEFLNLLEKEIQEYMNKESKSKDQIEWIFQI